MTMKHHEEDGVRSKIYRHAECYSVHSWTTPGLKSCLDFLVFAERHPFNFPNRVWMDQPGIWTLQMSLPLGFFDMWSASRVTWIIWGGLVDFRRMLSA
jgi:hypothetical protein